MTRRFLALLAVSFAMLCASSHVFAQTCTNLCLQQTTCPNGGTTSVTGTVYAPNGTDPLPNVLVYVPNGTLSPFTDGPNCVNGGEPVSGSPLVSTITATDGTFTLTNMPVGANIPLVIQAGRWRRQVTISTVTACASTALPASLVRFPRTKTEGDIPFIALVTGKVDQLECTLRKVGIADSEFTDPGGTGRVNLYAGSLVPNGAGAVIDANTPVETVLEGTSTTNSNLNSYDLAILSCEDNVPFPSAAQETNLSTFADAGGRVFASHFNYNWIKSNAEYGGVATWATNTAISGEQNGTVNTTFPKGAQLAQWLVDVGASTTLGTIALNAVRSDIATVVTPTQDWIDLTTGGNIQQITFNTPVGQPLANQCGRVLLLDYHVVDVPDSSPSKQIFPTECPTEATLTPQEKLVEYNLFDLENTILQQATPTNSLAITNSPAAFEQGDTADTISINVANTSGATPNTPGLTLKLTLPTGFTAVSLQGKNTNTGWSCNLGSLTCTQAGGLAGGASDPITLTVGVSTAATPTLANGGAVVTGVLSGGGLTTNVTATDTIPVAGANTLKTSNATPAPGQMITFTDTFPEVGTTPPTGTVSFVYTPQTGAPITLGTATTFTVAGGTVTATLNYTVLTSQLPIGGPYAVQAQLTGSNYPNAVSNFVNETVGPFPSTGDTLTALPPSILLGQSTTATFSIPVVAGVTTVPSSPVTFTYPNYGGTTTTTTANFSTTPTNNFWTATLVIPNLAAGKDTITGNYPGDSTYGATPNPLTAPVTVGPASGNLDTLAANPSTITAGQTTNITYSIPVITTTLGGPFTVAPTGNVTINYPQQGGSTGTLVAAFATTPTNGFWTATFSNVPNWLAGTTPDQVTSNYPGDGNYGTASPTTTVTVNAAASTDTLAANPPTISFGGSTVVTFSIPVITGLTVAPSGNVSITVPVTTNTVTGAQTGTTVLTAPFAATPTNGFWTATFSNVTGLPLGAQTITSSYPGDGNYKTASPTAAVTVNAAPSPGPSIVCNPSPSSFGQSVTCKNVYPPLPGTGPVQAPNCPVQFFVNGVASGTPVNAVSGTATFTSTTLPSGSDQISGTMAACGVYATTATPPVTQQVNPAATTDTLSSNNLTPTSGQPVTFTDTIPLINGVVPVGPVTFFNGANPIGTGTPTSTPGVYTLTTSTLPTGQDPITATLTADSNYLQSTSNVVTEQVGLINTNPNLVCTPTTVTVGQAVNCKDTNGPTSSPATCPVQLYVNGVAYGSPVVPVNGVANFSDSTLPAGLNLLSATQTACGVYATSNSNSVPVTVNQVMPTDVLSSNNTSPTSGQPVTFTDTITLVNGIVPAGPVTFFNGANPIGTGTPTSTPGVYTLTTSTLPVGQDPITAVLSPDTTYAQTTSNVVTEQVGAINTNPNLVCTPTTVTVGQTVNCKDTNGPTNSPATCPVQLYVNGVAYGTPVVPVNGVANFSDSALPQGVNLLSATQTACGVYATSNSNSVPVTVNLNTPNDVLSSSNTAPTYGQPVTFTDTITLANGVVPVGPVTFYNGTTSIGVGTPTGTPGVYTLTTSTLPVGPDPITAVLAADTTYAQTTSNVVNEQVAPIITTPTLICSPNPSTVGQLVTCTNTNGPVTQPSNCPVQFYVNGVAYGQPVTPVNGVATFSDAALLPGNDIITAVVQACGNFGQTTPPPVNQVVNLYTPGDVLSSNNTNPNFGTPVTLTNTITLLNGIVPAGPVTFYDGAKAIGIGTPTSTPGVYTLVTSTLPVGSNQITAVLSADNTYAQTTSNVVTEVVGPAANINDSLSSSNLTPTVGQPVTFTDTLTLVNGVVPTGAVTLYLGNTTPGTVIGTMTATGTPGVYTLTTSALPTGSDPVYAILAADATYAQTQSNTITETVGSPDFSITATPANQTINPGYATTYQVSLAGVNAAFTSPVTLTATGLPKLATVTFAQGTLVPGTGPTSTTMTIQTSPIIAKMKEAEQGGKIFYGLFLLPLLGLRRIRRKLRALPGGIAYLLMLAALLGGLGATIGCGGGYFGGPPQTYTITVTGTSGTLTHSTTVTLTVR